MADAPALLDTIQNSLAAGEISPSLYGRTDLAKFHQSAALMRNFFVDYKGGASTRPGTQFIGNPQSSGYARLIPFQFSPNVGQTYMLVFSAFALRFIKNPGGASYPNSSNSGYIFSGGFPYTIATPYAEADLPFLKFSQVADQMRITRHGYPRAVLKRLADTNWTLTNINPTANIIAKPVLNNITISPLPAGSPDPQNTRYQYAVTAVDANGIESVISNRVISSAGIDIGTTQGTVSCFWGAVVGAAFYRVYKALPTPGGVTPLGSEQLGFIGYSNGTMFTDSNIIPDFTRAPATFNDPFTIGRITGYNISASSNDWPVLTTTLGVTDASGSGAVLYPLFDVNTAGSNGHIVGIAIEEPGSGYVAPTVTAAGGGTTFTATLTLSPATGIDPDVCGLFQQRQIYASSLNSPNTLWGSRPSALDDFRTTNPIVDNDAYTFTIAAPQVNDILWVQSMPGGLVIGTNSGIVQLTAGSSSANNPLAVTPSSAVIVPQSYYGSADLAPIVIDYNILYLQAEGSIVRDLQYNFFVNIYTGTDITVFSSHLFYPLTIVSWAYQDVPKKVIWAVRSDGKLLSLTYLKEQEVVGWAQHDTDGLVEAVAVVREGSSDALYLSINRNGTRSIERLADRVYYQADDAWCLDQALSTLPTFPAANITLSDLTGVVTVIADAAVFNALSVGKVIRAFGGRGTVTGFTSTTQVTLAIDALRPFPYLNYTSQNWRLDPVVSTVSGLSHLNGKTIYALADGIVQGPFLTNLGQITLTTPASSVVVGTKFTAQIKTLYYDIGGEKTLQGQRKKIAAVTVRVKDTALLKYGTRFSDLQTWVQGTSSTDPTEDLPNQVNGLFLGDQRITLDPSFNVVGAVCVQQDQPLPATILAFVPEVALGDIG